MNRQQLQVRRLQLLAAVGELHIQQKNTEQRIAIAVAEITEIDGRLRGADPDGEDKH